MSIPKLFDSRFAVLALCLVLASGAAAQKANVRPGEKLKVEGTIVDRTEDHITVRQSASGTDLVVKVNGSTDIREKKMNPFRGAHRYQASQLAKGLAVTVEGRGDSSGSMVADKIRFTNDEYKFAQTVDTRVTPVEENSRRMSGQISELDAVSNAAAGGAKAAQSTADRAHDRINALDDYDTVQSTTIHFKVGSAVLSPEAKSSLDSLAEQAKTQKAFVIEVAGFASSEGGAEFNQRLSRQRSQAVAEYLFQKHDIPLRRILTPAGYGTTHPVADNTKRTGREENRRAEVRILVSKGMSTPASGGDKGGEKGGEKSPSGDATSAELKRVPPKSPVRQ